MLSNALELFPTISSISSITHAIHGCRETCASVRIVHGGQIVKRLEDRVLHVVVK